MAKLNLSTPWMTHYHELVAMFKYDPEVHVVYDEEENIIRLYVDRQAKADALASIIKNEMTFGNVKLFIEIVPANGALPMIAATVKPGTFEDAFKDNGAFSFVKRIAGIFSNDLTYVVFKNKVVQFFNDDLGDIYGNCSTLYQNIAKDIFNELEGVFYCTDVEEPVISTSTNTSTFELAKPLGEWP